MEDPHQLLSKLKIQKINADFLVNCWHIQIIKLTPKTIKMNFNAFNFTLQIGF